MYFAWPWRSEQSAMTPTWLSSAELQRGHDKIYVAAIRGLNHGIPNHGASGGFRRVKRLLYLSGGGSPLFQRCVMLR